jgi:hypothetical protein
MGIRDGGFIIEMGCRSMRDVTLWGFVVRHTP